MSGFVNPAITPPAHERRLSLEQLAQEVRELHDQRAEDYATLRDTKDLVSTTHLALGHQLGELQGVVLELKGIVKDLLAKKATP